MPNKRVIAAFAASAALLAGCAVPQLPTSGPTSTATPGAKIAAKKPGSITLAFAGDVQFSGRTHGAALNPYGLERARPYLEPADLTMVNFESSITSRGKSIPNKPYTFRAPESGLTTLSQAGVDIVGMANNHAVDYGETGLADTLTAKRRAPVEIIGIGHDLKEAVTPAVRTIDGVSIAILNVSPLIEETSKMYTATDSRAGIATFISPFTDPSSLAFRQAIIDANEKYDVVVVWAHWGTELEDCATIRQFELQRLFGDWGADAVLGGHSHRVQAGGWVNGANTYVAYGLSNFFWRSNVPSTGVLTLSIDPKLVEEKRKVKSDQAKRKQAKSVIAKESWQPMLLDDLGMPYVPDDKKVAELNAARDSLRGCSNIRATP